MPSYFSGAAALLAQTCAALAAPGDLLDHACFLQALSTRSQRAEAPDPPKHIVFKGFPPLPGASGGPGNVSGELTYHGEVIRPGPGNVSGKLAHHGEVIGPGPGGNVSGKLKYHGAVIGPGSGNVSGKLTYHGAVIGPGSGEQSGASMPMPEQLARSKCEDMEDTGFLLGKAGNMATCAELVQWCRAMGFAARVQRACPKSCGICEFRAKQGDGRAAAPPATNSSSDARRSVAGRRAKRKAGAAVSSTRDCAHVMAPPNLVWRQGTKDPHYVWTYVDTSACGFASPPVYVTSLSGEDQHFRTKGATSLYQVAAGSFLVYITHEEEYTVADAHANSWRMNFIGDAHPQGSDTAGGQVCSGTASNWQQYEVDSIYVTVDISACGFGGTIPGFPGITPNVVASLTGNGWHWRVTGVSTIYALGPTSFTVYIHTGFSSWTPGDATGENWVLNYVADARGSYFSSSGVCSGRTQVDAWLQYTNHSFYVDVDTSACGFVGSVAYVTSLNATDPAWKCTGQSEVYHATATGFRTYIHCPDAVLGDISDWRVNWLAHLTEDDPLQQNFVTRTASTALATTTVTRPLHPEPQPQPPQQGNTTTATTATILTTTATATDTSVNTTTTIPLPTETRTGTTYKYKITTTTRTTLTGTTLTHFTSTGTTITATSSTLTSSTTSTTTTSASTKTSSTKTSKTTTTVTSTTGTTTTFTLVIPTATSKTTTTRTTTTRTTTTRTVESREPTSTTASTSTLTTSTVTTETTLTTTSEPPCECRANGLVVRKLGFVGENADATAALCQDREYTGFIYGGHPTTCKTMAAFCNHPTYTAELHRNCFQTCCAFTQWADQHHPKEADQHHKEVSPTKYPPLDPSAGSPPPAPSSDPPVNELSPLVPVTDSASIAKSEHDTDTADTAVDSPAAADAAAADTIVQQAPGEADTAVDSPAEADAAAADIVVQQAPGEADTAVDSPAEADAAAADIVVQQAPGETDAAAANAAVATPAKAGADQTKSVDESEADTAVDSPAEADAAAADIVVQQAPGEADAAAAKAAVATPAKAGADQTKSVDESEAAGTETAGSPDSDAAAPICADDITLPCETMVENCNHDVYGEQLRHACPQTCGLCDGTEQALDRLQKLHAKKDQKAGKQTRRRGRRGRREAGGD